MRFHIGQRVKRPVNPYEPVKRWKYKYGKIVAGKLDRNEEVYEVLWDGEPTSKYGYFKCGLRAAEVKKGD